MWDASWDGRHPQYGQYLSFAEATELMRPAREHTIAVRDWLAANGLQGRETNAGVQTCVHIYIRGDGPGLVTACTSRAEDLRSLRPP